MTVPPGFNLPSRSAASIMASATRSLIEPVGFWFSSFTKSWHGPVSIRVISTSGVSPIRERMAGGFLVAKSGSGETSIMLNQAQPLVRIIDDNLVVAEKIIADDPVKLYPHRLT